MRPIEFRAWLKDEKKIIDVKAIDFDENGDVLSVNYPEGKSYSGYDKDNIELMQYTGLKDKNGVKIFEGDIAKNVLNNDIYEVIFTMGGFELLLNNIYAYPFHLITDNLEVIGNIYENPELLGD